MSLSHLKKKTHRKEARFYLSRNCAMAASLQYLLVTTQEAVRKGKNAKFARKGTQLLSMVIRRKKPKEKLEKSREKNDNEQKDFHYATVQQ